MNAALLAGIGAATGLHAATWGAFKDSPFEGFRLTSFARSVGLGVAGALLVGLAGVVGPASGVLVAVGVCYAGERLATEWWKSILREDPQTAYSIPMRLAVHGRPVDARLPRYAVGAAIAVGLVAAFVVASRVQGRLPQAPWPVTLLAVGLGGWLTAFGGAWKDAPVEGFQVAKFFRSPGVATVWGCLLLPFSSDLPVLIVAAGGLSVISIETYKTFLAGGAPGKFAGKPVRFTPDRARKLCRLTHAMAYVLLACVLGLTLLLGRAEGEPSAQLDREAALLVALVWACTLGSLVLGTFTSATVRTSNSSGGLAEPTGRLGDADIRRASI
jgi:hypothetical protein